MKNRANEKNKPRSLWVEAWRRLRKNKLAMAGLCFILLLVVLALFTVAVDLITHNTFYTEHVVKQNLRLRLQGPSKEHIFGLDEFGRDIFLRVIWAIRYSLFMGTVAIGISVVIGSILGAIAGFYGKVVDNVIMRIMDIFLAIPSMLLALAIVAAFGTSLTNLLLAIAISYVPTFARTVRASVLTVKESYIRDGWHITVIPGLMIMLTILSLNVLGDGLRDALDPRLKN